MEKKKIAMGYLQALSLRELLHTINTYNTQNPDIPILKEDIVYILHDEGTYILLYYK